jgi:hydrogenase/urease accessory protein HupE
MFKAAPTCLDLTFLSPVNLGTVLGVAGAALPGMELIVGLEITSGI